jgi:dTDP-4-dehydrorhamnose reductase
MKSSFGRLELWGGVECSVVRVGENFRNQIEATGHSHRISDLELVASLGIKTMRYPVIWETVCPTRSEPPDWLWQDQRLHELRRLGIAPIAGLLHHGSGPSFTSLLDPEFPELFASYAASVARRYPWIEYFTPINEPLTTARFSALYGHWYPHASDSALFFRALINQCAGISKAMKAIREINPGAKLIQTEDLGKTFSTGLLGYQARFENERRWLSLDLLCGRVDAKSAWWPILTSSGISESILSSFVSSPCFPDVIGINHYLTSERYLDENLAPYPERSHGGNGRHRYADVEAVRVKLPGADTGLAERLSEVWDRYRRPLAITEAHLGCTDDEQVRWLLDVWSTSSRMKRAGVEIRAVTIWSLFGAYDWNSLLTRMNGYYEPGAFDARHKPPRRTVLSRVATALAKAGSYEDADIIGRGWWERDDRYYASDCGVDA